jgi:CHRD domain
MASMRLPVLAVVLVLSACAQGSMGSSATQTMTVTASLNGASEVPPVNTAGTGTLQGTFDKTSKMLTWTVSYSGLTGPATAAHFHGPAAPGTNAGVVVNASPAGPPANPITGSATLTDAAAAQLLAGSLYFNIHTDANKPGEIRGQVAVK